MDEDDRLTTPEELADYDRGRQEGAHDKATGMIPRDVMNNMPETGAYWRGYYTGYPGLS